MRKGLTPNIEAIIDNVSQLECIKPYTLCGGTALAIQLGHRMSEDLDFMMSLRRPCVNFWYNILTGESLNQPTKTIIMSEKEFICPVCGYEHLPEHRER